MKCGSRRGLLIRALALGVMLIAAGCGNSDGPPDGADAGQVIPASGATDGHVVTFGTSPNPPAKGDNQVFVTVKRPDGSPITDGDVTAVFSMPAMPSMNMPGMRAEASLTHAGAGRYSGMSQLSMGGTWEVAISVREGAKELAARRTSIVAKE